jgi:hypothetical protein
VFEAHPDVGVIYGHAALVNASGEFLHVMWTPPFLRPLLRRYNFICQPTVFVRRSALGRAGFVDPAYDYMMDRELWLSLSETTTFKRIDRLLAIDRHHLQRKSYMRPDLARHDHELLVRRYALPRVVPNGVFVRTFKVLLRLAGLTRLHEAVQGSDLLALNLPSKRTLVTRQIAQLRRWMPSGDV